MSPSFRTTRRVEFRDTDAAGIMHFSVYFNYMEEAEHELLRRLGLSVMMSHADAMGAGDVATDGVATDGVAMDHAATHDAAANQAAYVSWPRVSVQCDYRGAARFEDLLDIDVRVERLGTKSVSYGFDFCRDGELLAHGRMTVVCCRVVPNEPLQSIPIPPSIAEKLSSLQGDESA